MKTIPVKDCALMVGMGDQPPATNLRRHLTLMPALREGLERRSLFTGG